MSVSRIAIVGSGPAAFYTCQHILKNVSTAAVSVDMFEKLPMPFGLVRFGIAPDHSDAKKVINKFDKFATEDPRFKFIGNVTIGRDLSVSELRANYDAVILSYGAEKPRLLGIPNEETTKNVHSAHDFVKWVNGYPNSWDSGSSNIPFDLSNTDTAVIVGQGNVALDVARLLLSPFDDLRKTDIPDETLAVLEKSRIKRVHLVGRRGPYQTAFTAKELRELTKLPGTTLTHNPILSSEPYKSSESDPLLDRGPKRLMQILHNVERPATSQKQWSLDWFLTPHEIIQNAKNAVEAIRFQRTRPIQTTAGPYGAKIEAVPGEFVDLSCGLLVSSVGYYGESIGPDVPFDASKGVIPNIRGSVVTDLTTKTTIPGLYASGWIKRGAVGVIAATMYDAVETADSVLQDLESLKSSRPAKSGFDGVSPLLHERGVTTVSYSGWKVLDAFERKEGEKRGKEREKVVELREALRIIQ
ncbi:hypothetical protein BDR26DRAFT_912706 [Obelidium mucronatum]|nr:hypothetical protein BDR26DRAFT_912706 [Obelidium mucronatum]